MWMVIFKVRMVCENLSMCIIAWSIIAGNQNLGGNGMFLSLTYNTLNNLPI